MARLYVGKTLLILSNVFSLFLIYGYADIACSIMPNNLLGVNYEPSGIQMLYYIFVIPVFTVLSLAAYLIKKYITQEPKLIAAIPLLTAFTFYIFMEFVDAFVSFPRGNELFYQGSLLLALLFVVITLGSIFMEVHGFIKARGQS